jgi:hypothetical protein
MPLKRKHKQAAEHFQDDTRRQSIKWPSFIMQTELHPACTHYQFSYRYLCTVLSKYIRANVIFFLEQCDCIVYSFLFPLLTDLFVCLERGHCFVCYRYRVSVWLPNFFYLSHKRKHTHTHTHTHGRARPNKTKQIQSVRLTKFTGIQRARAHTHTHTHARTHTNTSRKQKKQTHKHARTHQQTNKEQKKQTHILRGVSAWMRLLKAPLF